MRGNGLLRPFCDPHHIAAAAAPLPSAPSFHRAGRSGQPMEPTMMSRSTIRGLAAALATATLLAGANGADAARAPSPVKSAPVASLPTPTQPVTTKPAPDFGRYGWGYGRGWCYWHPYSCYRR